MEQLVESYRNVAASPELREQIRQRERAKHNEASALANAERKTEIRERRKYVQHMYQKGLSVEMIVDYLGLSVDEVKNFLSRK